MAKTVLAIMFFFTNIFYLKSQTLFGITFNGGTNNGGTLNKFIADIKSFNVERSLDAGGFAAYPAMTNLIQASEGVLYGMTSLGGSNGYGAIFSFDPVSSTYKKLKDFGYTDGGIPLGSLVQTNDGKLYGTTSGGGANGYGIIFSYDPSSASYSVVEQFNNTDGASPEGSLIQAGDGKLYGMTTAGGSSNEGVIFTFDPGTSMYTKLKDLDDNTGSAPTGSFLQASDGKLYGMASMGGSNGSGTIFSFDPATATFAKLKDLDNNAGSSPLGSLLQATDGKLYGMTARGGIYDQGVIFSFDPVSSVYMKVKDFAYGDGAGPQGSLIQASDGNLYGMTRSGGFEGAGVIFSLDPVSNTYTQLMDFDLVHGGYPQGSVIQATNGKLYGLTSMGLGGDAGSFGVIFSLDISNYAYNIEKGFGANQNGTNVSGGLIRASDGKLYGMTIF